MYTTSLFPATGGVAVSTMRVVGLMSGTSLDGIDACLVDIHGVGRQLRHTVCHFLTLPWPAGLRERLAIALTLGPTTLAEVGALHVALGEAFAEAVDAVCAAADVPLASVDLVGSHGQTLFHHPEGREPVTLQLGDATVIAARTGLTTVSDFRAADVALGGQGAPLVPYADRLLYVGRERPLALQNLGGIGNVTYLGVDDALLAFDTGPGNRVIDGLVERLTDGRETMDAGGRRAARGRVDDALVAAWLAADAYLDRRPPKSTGREHYDAAFIDARLAEARAAGLSDDDVIATATAWTAATVADQYARFLPAPPREVIVAGGGARNATLMTMLARALAPARMIDSRDAGVDPDAKEALAFALLAYQCVMGEPNSEPAATGARASCVLGRITPGRNFARALLRPQPPSANVVATETINPDSVGLDALATRDMVALMHAQDFQAVLAVSDEAQAAIAATIDTLADRLRRGGRLLYVGAGTSGRLGVLDASECPPTFSTPPELVQGLIAGGDRALREPVEGAEDDAEAGARDLQARGLAALDVVVGLSANGGAPYVQGALAAARAAGAATALVTCNPLRPGLFVPDHLIVVPVGSEILSGSTRLKSGTATKLVLNMLTTLTMARLGKVHDNLMVDLTISNRKLRARAARLVMRLTGLEEEAASALLDAASGNVKRAAVMHHTGADPAGAAERLEASHGHLRPWLTSTPSPTEAGRPGA